MHRVEPLTGKAAREFGLIVDEFVKRPLAKIGDCSDCHRAIPQGYVHYASKWGTIDRSGMKVLVPVEIQCHDCGLARREGSRRRAPQRAPQAVEEPAPTLTAKEIAVRLWRALSDEPHGSKKLASLAGLEYRDHILQILRKLRDAGKVRLEDGRWAKA